MFNKFYVFRGEEEAGDDGVKLSRAFVILKKTENMSELASMMLESRGKKLASFVSFGIPGLRGTYYRENEIRLFANAIGPNFYKVDTDRALINAIPRAENYLESYLYKQMI
jgi:hypothetical protein